MSGASVVVDGETVGEIRGRGLCVLVGVTHDDTKEKAERLARKLWTVRLFDGDGDGDGGGEAGGDGESGTAGPGSEKSCSDLGAPLMVISQFTLYGDARKGRRPTWNAAAPGELAEPLVDEVVARLRSLGARVETGRFGADMKVSLTNDGPFTVLLEV